MNIITILLTVILLGNCDIAQTLENNIDSEIIELSMYDKDASAETKALYANLWAIRKQGCMVGHHESLLYGRNWNNEPGRSDIKDICGDYPAVVSLDFAKIEYQADSSINGPLFNDVRRVTKEAYARGEVITYCWHADNPLTGGTAWDNSSKKVVSEILKDGSAINIKFKTWLDNLAAFANTLTDNNGRPIPIIFRPFHEHTQTWNWWGKKCATEEEFIGLWRFTLNYLRNEKQIHHFIYAISPQMDFVQPSEDLLFRWPGDDYVDFLGMDCYHGTNIEAFTNNLTNLSKLSHQKMKPFGVTETGLEGLGNNYNEYWTNEMLSPLSGRSASLVVFWRNMYDPKGTRNHFYAPFKGQSSSNNFLKFYKSQVTLFSKDLPPMYQMPKGYEIK
ncbi:MAG TPA: glycosyl hydrolase [Prolixibacteraceae bacterium]|nr:glycosyl hydrolase [Prolixibacteraceae bacterium]